MVVLVIVLTPDARGVCYCTKVEGVGASGFANMEFTLTSSEL